MARRGDVRAGCFGTDLALQTNHTGTFHDQPRQPHQVATGNPSPWLTGLAGTTLHFPCAHGEGRLTYRSHTTGQQPGQQPALHYPPEANPDGSTNHIAGITTPDGLVFRLMNHPERATDPDTRHAFFHNGVQATRN